MTEQEEEYVHFVSSIQDLNSAWVTLQDRKQSEGHRLVSPAFQFALIAYAKPYRTSRGAVLNSKDKPLQHRLDSSRVPTAHLDLHNRLLKARDQIHAHSDLTVMEAKLYVARTSTGPRAFIAQNVILGDAGLSNTESIIDLIEKTLKTMYVEVKGLEAQLTPNS